MRLGWLSPRPVGGRLGGFWVLLPCHRVWFSRMFASVAQSRLKGRRLWRHFPKKRRRVTASPETRGNFRPLTVATTRCPGGFTLLPVRGGNVTSPCFNVLIFIINNTEHRFLFPRAACISACSCSLIIFSKGLFVFPFSLWGASLYIGEFKPLFIIHVASIFPNPLFFFCLSSFARTKI